MRVALFVPCYIDQLYPQVAIDTFLFLKKYGVEVLYPKNQTCCGQPMANSGCEVEAELVYKHFVNIFNGFDYIVSPSASCTYHVKKHYDKIGQTADVLSIRDRIYEFSDFLSNVLHIEQIKGHYPFKVGLHLSCHGQRGLHNATASEITHTKDGTISRLLKSLKGIELTSLDRYDECCGFGGTFCVSEEAISSRMGYDRIVDHVKNGTQILTGGDMSCLMHLEGIIKRQKVGIKVLHVAQILNSSIS
jgi:L-lactate dehydrogenase complex protein LldE